MKILYGVQGTGNGHISRSRVMAQAFQNAGIAVDFLFSGREPEGYFSMQAFGRYQTRRGLTFVSDQGHIHGWQTAIQAKPWQLLREINELDLQAYDLVLNDFEPVSAWAARRQKIPCIGISHQNSFRDAASALACHPFHPLFIRTFAPCDQHIGLHWHHFEHSLLPPVVNVQQKDAKCAIDPHQVLVYLPFEDLTQILNLLQVLTAHHFVCYHPVVKVPQLHGNVLLKPLSYLNFVEDLSQSAAVLSNAGFELPSEALTLGKKLLVKPLAGQFEQVSNANVLEMLGLGWQMPTLELTTMQRWLASEPAQPTQFPCVASALVAWLIAGNWQQPNGLKDLSAMLWSQVRYPTYAKLGKVVDKDRFKR